MVTDLAGTLKLSPGASDVWVTSMESGEPLEGVTVELMKGAEVAATTVTAADGLAHFEQGPQAQNEVWNNSNAYWARLSLGSDVSFVEADMSDGISPWQFDIYTSFEPKGFGVTGHGFADRGVYRPGDKIYARGTFRKQTARGLETVSYTHLTLPTICSV